MDIWEQSWGCGLHRKLHCSGTCSGVSIQVKSSTWNSGPHDCASFWCVSKWKLSNSLESIWNKEPFIHQSHLQHSTPVCYSFNASSIHRYVGCVHVSNASQLSNELHIISQSRPSSYHRLMGFLTVSHIFILSVIPAVINACLSFFTVYGMKLSHQYPH